ncbi:Transposase IS1 domain-containing protein [Desulfonema magnum]|uniref:Transposase IS1 domain-containing protein n=1 Tax=Desulfonema magnum TaxID=45655 RepID=A0A975BPD4_9BACT|nr:IS1-like element transposase [Desulfonema magnum]QTA88630.1 Transposase IS1 domain-containing protein [Desulfonema magnum]
MALIPVRCPLCGGGKVKKGGKTDDGKQRYLCQNENCETKSFLLDYTYNARKSDIKDKIIEMSLSGGGIRDIARVPEISTDTVISELKKRKVFPAR